MRSNGTTDQDGKYRLVQIDAAFIASIPQGGYEPVIGGASSARPPLAELNVSEKVDEFVQAAAMPRAVAIECTKRADVAVDVDLTEDSSPSRIGKRYRFRSILPADNAVVFKSRR